MKAVGIVSEYNPLHNGHLHHISESRRLTGAEIVIAAMSGDFVQRGEPAIMDKWVRARHALENGVDVVLEIPTYYALGNASIYAASGVHLLENLGVSWISFGSESGDSELLSLVASRLMANKTEIEEGIAKLIKSGLNYPSAREEIYRELFSSSESLDRELEVLRNSNDILAVEYLMKMKKAEALPIKRVGALHDEIPDVDEVDCRNAEHTGSTENDASEDSFKSASYIRSLFRKSREYESDKDKYLDMASSYLPYDLRESVDPDGIYPFSGKWFETIRYKLLSAKAEEFYVAPSGGEGIENRLKEAVRNSSDINELILFAKSKRYTYTRISRLLMQLVLDINKDEYPELPGYARILGFTERGREYLAEIKRNESSEIPLITNINKEAQGLDIANTRSLELDIHAADIYHLTNGEDIYENSEKKMMPIMVDNQ